MNAAAPEGAKGPMLWAGVFADPHAFAVVGACPCPAFRETPDWPSDEQRSARSAVRSVLTHRKDALARANVQRRGSETLSSLWVVCTLLAARSSVHGLGLARPL